MAEEQKPAVFFASDNDKQKASQVCDIIISLIQESSEEILFQAYIMQMLLESFEDTYNIDIRHGMSVSQTKQGADKT